MIASIICYASLLCADDKVAVIVGISNYQDSAIDSLSSAPLKDCQEMGDYFESKGYKVIPLSNGKASKSEIKSTLSGLRGSCKNLVFYYSGHGTQSETGSPLLMPYDFDDATGGNGFSDQELQVALTDVGAPVSTVILDSCFSGAMMRGRELMGGRVKPKYYRWKKLRQDSTLRGRPLFGERTSRRLDGNQSLIQGGLCYFTACASNELAWYEADRHGFFTESLLAALKGDSGVLPRYAERIRRDQAPMLGDLHREVVIGVEKLLERHRKLAQQRPQLSSAYYQTSFLSGAPESGSINFDSVADALAFSRPDDRVLGMGVEINGKAGLQPMSVKAQDELDINLTFASGYVVLVNRDTEGRYQLLFPKGGRAVEKRGGIRLPEKGVYTAENTGYELMKVFLFAKESDAQALIDAIGKQSGTSFRQLMGERPSRLRGQSITPSAVTTAEFTVYCVN